MKIRQLSMTVLSLSLSTALPAKSAPPVAKSEQVEVKEPFKSFAPLDDARCYSSPDHDVADLCAQWRAALAAERATVQSQRATDLAYWSLLASVLLGLLSTGGLILTVLQTRGALKESRRGNRIALASERHARRQNQNLLNLTQEANALAQSTQRPWLSVEMIQFNNFHWDNDGHFRCDYRLSVTNHGGQPAMAVCEYVGLQPDVEEYINLPLIIERANEFIPVKAEAVVPGQTIFLGAGKSLIETPGVPDNGTGPNGRSIMFSLAVSYKGPQLTTNYLTLLQVAVSGTPLNKNGPAWKGEAFVIKRVMI